MKNNPLYLTRILRGDPNPPPDDPPPGDPPGGPGIHPQIVAV